MRDPRPLPLLPILLLTLAGLVAETPAQPAGMQTAGQVVVHGDKLIVTSSTAWLDIPGMKGAITLQTGGDLAVTLTLEGEVTGGTRPVMFARAIVDNQVLSPSLINFFVRDLGRRTQTTTFFAGGLKPGPHRVRLQWKVNSGVTARAWGRTLVMRFARPDSPDLRLASAKGTSISRKAGGWLDLPGMVAEVDCPWDARLVINVTGELFSLGAQQSVILRAVIDQKVIAAPGPVSVAYGDSHGAASFTFISGKLGHGKHKVSVQWECQGNAVAYLPVLNVTALPDATNRRTGWLQQSVLSTDLTNSKTFVPVPKVGGNVHVPARGDLTIRFCADLYARQDDQIVIRPRVDGNTANCPDYVFHVTRGTQVATREAVFVVRDVARGMHKIDLQWKVIPSATPLVGMLARTLAVTAIVGQRPLLVTAMESNRPKGYQYGGPFASTVVEVKNNRRVFRPYVPDTFWRTSPGIAAWFLENSEGQMHVVEAGVIGPGLKKYDEKYYREQVPSPRIAMITEALQTADKQFDFYYYDRNCDGLVTPDELACLVVFYQDTTFGEVRTIPKVAVRGGISIDYGNGVAVAYTPDFKAPPELGVIDHQLSHLLLKTADMTEKNDPTAPGPYSIMDDYALNSHLDPLHKLKCGKWFDPFTVIKEGYRTIQPIERGGNVYKLEDSKTHKGEYFLVENRQRIGNHLWLPSDGLAVWHCDESRLPNWLTAVEIEPASGPNYRYQDYLFRGVKQGFDPDNDLWDSSAKTDTRWHDKTPSRIGVWAVQRVGNQGDIKAFFDLPGPGVLCQVEHRRQMIDPFGNRLVRIRIVNTHTAADAFKVTAKVSGWASWTTRFVQLKGYESRILELVVKPTPSGFTTAVTVTAESTTNPAIQCTDDCVLRYTLRAVGATCPGCKVALECSWVEEANKFYEMRASFGSEPGFVLPGAGTIPLHADVLFFVTPYLAGVFQSFQGRLDATGSARAYVAIPNDNRLKGVAVYCAYLTYDTGLGAASNAAKIEIK